MAFLEGCAAGGWRGSVASEWEGRFGPDGLGVGVPAAVPVAAVGGLAGDAEGVADVGPAGAPVEGPGDRCVEGVLGGLFGGCGVDGGGECVGAESFGAVHQGCHLRVTRRCLSACADRHRRLGLGRLGFGQSAGGVSCGFWRSR
jgi:hypothetical protein